MSPFRLPLWVLFSSVLALGAALIASDDPPRPEVLFPDLRVYRNRPWHMTTVISWFHDRDDPQPLESLSVEFQLVGDLPESPQLFAVPITGYFNEEHFYFGVLSRSYDVKDGNSFVRVRSPGFIFTRWGTMDSKYARPAKAGHVFGSDHEKEHVSARAPGNTASGRYTFTLKVVEKVSEGKTPHIWVGAYVYSHATKKTDHVGDLRFDGATLALRYGITSFLEVVADEDFKKNRSDTMPETKVAVGRWAIDGKRVKPMFIRAMYEETVPQKAKAFLWEKAAEADLKGVAAEMKEDQTFVITLRDKPFTREGLKRIEEKRKKSGSGEPVGWMKQETLFQRR